MWRRTGSWQEDEGDGAWLYSLLSSILLNHFFLFCLSLLIVLPHSPDSKFDPKLIYEDTTVPLTRGNLFDRVFKSLCEDSELKLYHEVAFDLAKVYTPSLAVHPAIEERA